MKQPNCSKTWLLRLEEAAAWLLILAALALAIFG